MFCGWDGDIHFMLEFACSIQEMGDFFGLFGKSLINFKRDLSVGFGHGKVMFYQE
jgi:hypothetical protein